MGVEIMIEPRMPAIAFLTGAVALLASAAATAQDVERVAAGPGTLPGPVIDGGPIQVQGSGDDRDDDRRDGRRADRNFGEVVDKRGTVDGNLFVAGETVTVDAEVDGDVLAFGQTVAVGSRIAGDVLAAGETVTVRGTVLGDVRIAGERVTPAAEIGGDVMAAAQRVTLPADARVGGDAWLAGERVTVIGAVAGNVYAGARTIRIAGTVDGDADLRGERITIAATARIAGDLTYRSHRDITIEPGAEIGGDTVFVRTDGPRDLIGGLLAGLAALAVTFWAGILVLGALQTLVMPGLAATTAGWLARRPAATLGLGAAVVLAGPVAMVLLVTTVVGIPIAVLGLAAYILALTAGFLAASGALGRRGARLMRWNADASFFTRFGAFAAGFVVLSVVGLVPVLGPLTMFVATAVGIGALTLQMREAQGPGG